MSRCCCGKYDLKDDIAFVSNGYQHEIYGPQKNFCGQADRHIMWEMHNRINQLEQERDRLKKQCMDAECPGASFIAEGSAEWEERAKNAESEMKELTIKLHARDDALSAAKKLRLCFPDTVKAAKFDIPRYIIDEFDEKLKAVEAEKATNNNQFPH